MKTTAGALALLSLVDEGAGGAGSSSLKPIGSTAVVPPLAFTWYSILDGQEQAFLEERDTCAATLKEVIRQFDRKPESIKRSVGCGCEIAYGTRKEESRGTGGGIDITS